MSQTNSSTTPKSAPQPTTVAQQGDNIAHALAGAGGGLLSMTLTYPLITLSTRAQVESKRANSSTLDAARRIVQREGIQGLYSGLESALFGISVTNFVYYYWYEWSRSFFERRALQQPTRRSSKLTTVESMLAGALAGSATVLLTNPIWVVNTRMTARSSSSSSGENAPSARSPTTRPTDAKSSSSPTIATPEQPRARSSSSPTTTLATLLALVHDEGPLALFAGVLPALVLVVNPILQYTIFEQLKNLLERRPASSSGSAGKKRPFTARDAFALGALGKLLATSITYPYITVKSRMHVAKGGDAENMFSSFSRILREEGWSGLYGGIVPKVTQSVITAAFLFAFKDVLYEASVRLRKGVPAAAPGVLKN